MAGESWARRVRGISCVLLLALLAVCGYIGAGNTEKPQTVSVAMTRETITPTDSAQGADERLAAQRQEEIDMLQGVIDNPQTDESTRQSALAQVTQIAERMELEAQAVACLEQMGFSGVSAVCGAQMMSLILPYDDIKSGDDQIRIIDAVCGQTGFSPDSVKIILTKK